MGATEALPLQQPAALPVDAQALADELAREIAGEVRFDGGRASLRSDLLPRLPASVVPRAIEGGAHRDRVDPGRQSAVASKVGQRTPDPDENLLQELLSAVDIALPSPGEGPDAAVMFPIHRLERLEIVGRQRSPPDRIGLPPMSVRRGEGCCTGG